MGAPALEVFKAVFDGALDPDLAVSNPVHIQVVYNQTIFKFPSNPSLFSMIL